MAPVELEPTRLASGNPVNLRWQANTGFAFLARFPRFGPW